MKIADVEAIYVRMPLKRVQVHELVPTQADHGAVIAKITCDNGLVGIGRTYGGSVFGSHAVKASITHDFASILIGEDPTRIHYLWSKMEVASHYHGRAGIAFSAVSAIDIALWDIMGKACGLPLYRLLGAARESVRVYSSEGWVYLSVDELVHSMESRVDEGYRAVKLRLPSDRSGCIAKMRAVRDALGPDRDIMIDVQNTWENVSTAVKNAQAVAEYLPFWIEEPVMVQDLDGHAKVNALTGIPVAGGEHIYSKHLFREAFSKQAFSYAQPDSFRVGGVTEIQKIIGMAESWFVPVVPHGAYEVHVHIALSHTEASVPFVELLTDSEAPLLSSIYKDFKPPVNGIGTAPDRPGLGVTLNDDGVRDLAVRE
jgi:L-rhamnonate dehydratase